MADWQDGLQRALDLGDPTEMKAALSRVPEQVLRQGVPIFSRLADDSMARGDPEEALTYFDQLIGIEPDQVRWRIGRARANVKLDQLEAVVEDAVRITELEPEGEQGYRLLAEAHDGLRDRRAALAAYERLQSLQPDDGDVRQRIEELRQELHKEELLQRALDPDAAAPAPDAKPDPLPAIVFDPSWLSDPAMPESTNMAMVAGLRQHLLRYGVHQSSRNALSRLEDEAWLQAWDAALAATVGGRVLMHGSELGTFAARALQHGATHVTILESSPIDARIASGIVQKHLLIAWHAQYGQDIQSWSEEERRASFEAYTSRVEVLPEDAAELQPASYDWLLVPGLDHTLLGSGIACVVQRYRERGMAAARVLPGKARVFAMAVQWDYPGTDMDIQALSALRWSPYPQPLELASDCWTALTAPAQVGEIDFNDFAGGVWACEFPVVAAGTLDAIMFWFELELGEASLDSGVDGGLRCLRPAVQYTDRVGLVAGAGLAFNVHVSASRLYFETAPAARAPRSGTLPSWYVPMLVDASRNRTYRTALQERLAETPGASVLDIGAGCGLLSVMAAQQGARNVYACEVDSRLARVAEQVAAANEGGDKVQVLTMDCRAMTVPGHVSERAELALFELFDCSLIGEGVLHYLAYAREHLLKDAAEYLPMAGHLRAMLVEYRLDRVFDVDVNILNPYRFSPEFVNVDAERLRHRPLSEPFDVFAFDFARAGPTPQECQIEARTIADGIAGAVLFWFDLQMTPDRWLSNAPASGQSYHWKQGLQFLPEVQVRTGMELPLTARHNGSALMFRWRQDALSAEAFSQLPRFDPRVFQQASELQAQTVDLFRHCMGDPEEYARVAEVALRFAVDPAAHGLDPKIAERFAAKFLASGA